MITINYINLALGQSDDWNNHFAPAVTKNLNEIGYTGKLKGNKTTLKDYLKTLDTNKVERRLECIKADSGDFTMKYMLITATK